MSQCCPVCRTRLWTDPLFTLAKLECPRCGAVFRPTVPWGYFRLVLLIVILLIFFIVVLFTSRNIWLLLFMAGVVVSLWYLPRIIDLQYIPGELEFGQGIRNLEQIKLRFEDIEWNKRREQAEEKVRFRRWMYFLVALTLVLLIVSLVGGLLD